MSESKDRKRQAPDSLQTLDVLKKHHKFLRESDEEEEDEHRGKLNEKEKKGVQLAKKYYDKLYKEFALVNLAKFETGQIGCRWRSEKEVIAGKGETICGEVACGNRSDNVFEMNFGYVENGSKKNALVMVSVCKDCAFKLNYKKMLKKVS